MSNKTVLGIIVILAAVGGLAWWGLGSKKTEVPPPDQGSATYPPEKLTVNHYFQENGVNGSHTIEGTITLPTPCHTITNEVLVAESFPEQISINFTTHPDSGICTQVLADKFFRVSFQASKDAIIRATLDGKPIELVFSENLEGITK